MKASKTVPGVLATLAVALLAACSWDPEASNETGREEGAGTLPVALLTSNPGIAGVAGCWRVTQGFYIGSLALQQTGSGLRGYMDWDNHEDAMVTGTAGPGRVDMVFTYLGTKKGLTGWYPATASADGRTLQSDGPVEYTFQWMPCEAGCWRVTQENYRGVLTLASRNGVLAGYMDWEGHADATVTGRSAAGKADMRFSYLDDKEGVVGIYNATLSADGLTTLEGTTYDEAIPSLVVPVSGESIPCKDVSGCFYVNQVNRDGGRFNGRIRLDNAGSVISGHIDWLNHPSGQVAGSLTDRRLDLEVTHPGTPKEGLVGFYDLLIDASGDYFTGSTTSSTGDAATLSGARTLCP